MFGSLHSIAVGMSDKHGITRIEYPTRQVFTSYKQGNKVVQYAKLYIYRSLINPYLISPIFAIPLTLYPVTEFSFFLMSLLQLFRTHSGYICCDVTSGNVLGT